MLNVRYVQKPNLRIMLLTFHLPTMNYLNYLRSALHYTQTTRFPIFHFHLKLNKAKVSSIVLRLYWVEQVVSFGRTKETKTI